MPAGCVGPEFEDVSRIRAHQYMCGLLVFERVPGRGGVGCARRGAGRGGEVEIVPAVARVAQLVDMTAALCVVDDPLGAVVVRLVAEWLREGQWRMPGVGEVVGVPAVVFGVPEFVDVSVEPLPLVHHVLRALMRPDVPVRVGRRGGASGLRYQVLDVPVVTGAAVQLVELAVSSCRGVVTLEDDVAGELREQPGRRLVHGERRSRGRRCEVLGSPSHDCAPIG